MKGQIFVGVTFLVLIFLIAGQYYEIHHLRVANQTFQQHNRVVPVEQYVAGMTEAIDQQNRELTEMLSQTLWTTRRLAACIEALELQHNILSPPADDLAFIFSYPQGLFSPVWNAPFNEEKQVEHNNISPMVPMLMGMGPNMGGGDPLVFYESYQPEDPNSFYYIPRYSGEENTLEGLLSCLRQNSQNLSYQNSDYRKLIEQCERRLKILNDRLKEKNMLPKQKKGTPMPGTLMIM
ncbi:MAG: hypothetical protein ABFD91_07895 [Anaerohalosphaeraceae bacterium]